MRLFYATESLLDVAPESIFLAGPTPRSSDVSSWRSGAIQILKNLGYTGDVLIPEPRNGAFSHSYDSQIDWEPEGLSRAGVIVFWIPRELKDMPAFTTNIEFGAWYKSGKIVFGSPENAEKMNYLIYVAQKQGIIHHNDLTSTLREAISRFYNNPTPKVWFTSDTHFGAKDTLHYSLRPFSSTYEMDEALIANWNRLIKPGDIVYHLGDFGQYDTIKRLNGSVHLLFGNYERKDVSAGVISETKLLDLGFHCIHLHPFELEVEDLPLRLVHEPSARAGERFHLFGHIHGVCRVKRNSLNVGVDAHHFSPISLETVRFHKEAIEHSYDDEVFLS